ncbi:MAG: L,D-transpeptidase family protein [Paracoccaceae bacterium]|nr:L,D-transpeptidase family protein [Paracoccaceae bacterium]
MRTVILNLLLAVSVAAGLSGCSKFRTYNGPEVTRVVVMKSERRMYLIHYGQVLKAYEVDLGFSPAGSKEAEGDGRTPEGRYVIDRRNPNSDFHLSLGISYPNEFDLERASSMGLSPGGDIFIHGGPRRGTDRRGPDWTAGCISVSNREIEHIYAMVKEGTPIDIYP